MPSFGKACVYGAAIVVFSVPAAQAAQVTPNFGSSGTYREDSASALARYLRMVTANPHDLEALTGAGRAALQVGDAQAAIGFYARAEALAPKNGRVKAGLGSALVLLNQEQAALRYFDEATQLGVPDADIASDRGLAYDLRGNPKRAQRDYGIALKRGDDPETTRRLALSMAIGGDGNGALVLLDPLLRKQDTAAWRARAFILAMTGDAAGASKAAEAVMPSSTAAGFAPFFRKLPSLRPGEKAAAVHFGLFPGEGRPMRIDDLFNQAEVAARVALENTPRSATDAGRVDAGQGAFGRLALRTPDAEGQLSTRLVPRPVVEERPIATPRPNAAPTLKPSNDARIAAALAPAPGSTARPSTSVPTRAPQASPVTVAPAPVTIAPAPVTIAPAPARPVTLQPVTVAKTTSVPPASLDSGPTPGFATNAPLSPSPPTSPALDPALRLADVSATVRAAAGAPVVQLVALPPSSATGLPDAPPTTVAVPSAAPAGRLGEVARVIAEAPRAVAPVTTNTAIVPPAPTPKVETKAVPAASRLKAETLPPMATSSGTAAVAAKLPAEQAARVWVQVAGGADEGALPATWQRLKGQAPDLLGEQTAWTTPLKATNRLLVGPFASERDAQEFVNKLKPKGIDAFSWTSPKDQAIARLASR